MEKKMRTPTSLQREKQSLRKNNTSRHSALHGERLNRRQLKENEKKKFRVVKTSGIDLLLQGHMTEKLLEDSSRLIFPGADLERAGQASSAGVSASCSLEVFMRKLIHH